MAQQATKQQTQAPPVELQTHAWVKDEAAGGNYIKAVVEFAKGMPAAQFVHMEVLHEPNCRLLLPVFGFKCNCNPTLRISQ